MKKILFSLIAICLAYCLFAQKHSLSLTVDASKSVHSFDRLSEQDESVSLQFNGSLDVNYGLIYSHKLNSEGFRIDVGFMNLSSPMSISWEAERRGSRRVSGDRGPAIQLGLGYDFKSNISKNFGLTFGYAARHIYKPNSSIFSSGTTFINADCIEGCFRSFVRTKYLTKGRIHSNLFFKTEYDLWINKRAKCKLSLNLVGNLGLHNIKQKRSILFYTETGFKNILLNNNGNYYSVGLTYSRLSDDKLKDLFKFRGKNGKLDTMTKIAYGMGGLLLGLFFLS